MKDNINKVNVFKSTISDNYVIFGNRSKINTFPNTHSHQTITKRLDRKILSIIIDLFQFNQT